MDLRTIITEAFIDPQQHRVYRAENEAFRNDRPQPKYWNGPGDEDSVSKLIHDKVTWHPELTKMYGQAGNIKIDVNIPKHEYNGDAGADENGIDLTGWVFHHDRRSNRTGKILAKSSTSVVAHEVAHTIHNRLSTMDIGKGSHVVSHAGGYDHGPQFAAVYLNVVHTMMGQKAHDKLKSSFEKHGVKYTVPRVSLNSRDDGSSGGARHR